MVDVYEFKGTRWFKCDFHLHTTSSDCFTDKSVTAEEWVNNAIEKGINCVAVTDHNTSYGIDSIKEAAKDKKLIVFPGVEITCDTSKIHLLILFDTNKSADDVRDFLVKCNISREEFGKQTAYTSSSIFEVAELASNEGCVIIPAHIDEYNGLGNVSHANLESFYSLESVNAVQVVNQEFLQPNLVIKDSLELQEKLNTYYGNDIDFTTITNWYTPVKIAKEKNLAILTFSDNPHEPGNSKHGLFGIGEKYTWIKMDENPTLESLRQSLLIPDMRVRNYFESKEKPYEQPKLWIKSVELSNSILTDGTSSFTMDFNPQLTNIIGGRGSGKSSVLRIIRGAFNKLADIENLEDIIKDHYDFYRLNDHRTGKGVFNEDSEIKIIFFRNAIPYEIKISAITNSQNQTIEINKYSKEQGIWTPVNEERFLEFFEFEQYSQKQIYEIAQNTNALRERIDKNIEGLSELWDSWKVLRKEYFEKASKIRTIEEQISNKGKIQTEINDLNEQIEAYEKSQIAELISKRDNFLSNENILTRITEDIESKINLYNSILEEIEIEDQDFESFSDIHKDELIENNKNIISFISKIKKELENQKVEFQKQFEEYKENISKSTWKVAYDENLNEFNKEKESLENEGITDVSNFELLRNTKILKEQELNRLVEIENQLAGEVQERNNLHDQIVQKLESITQRRKDFIRSLSLDQKVKVNIKPFRNKLDFEQKFRKIIQREDTFTDDIDYLVNLCFNGNVKEKIKEFRGIISILRNNGNVPNIHGHFKNVILNLSDPQMDEINILMPEDEIEVQYKPEGSNQYKPLSTASAGQKTTAILTFLLSYGNVPLILDQPEDDLDNRLVYDLIVDRVKQAKQKRQLIIVTHNANIPVNGDAELINSLNSESRYLNILYSGSLDQKFIKKEICEVMEGSEFAFEMRAKRYKELKYNRI